MLKGYKFTYKKDEFVVSYNMLADVQTESLGVKGTSPIKVTLTMYVDSYSSIEMGELAPGDKDYID